MSVFKQTGDDAAIVIDGDNTYFVGSKPVKIVNGSIVS